ncbi:MAG: NADPH-dependent curcumin reductase CurA [Candidatus Azotimanducaceae bacterium]|jgi:NADPH-dependent curcumin reductase CurA
MTQDTCRQFTLAARPKGKVREQDLALQEVETPSPIDGEFLVRNEYFSLDPSMKGHMEDRSDYRAPLQLGSVMAGRTVGTIVESNHPDYPTGGQVFGFLGMSDYTVTDGKRIPVHLFSQPVNPEAALGVLGGTGMTAYFGLTDVGKPKSGDVLVVSGAAGATGNVAGQIGKILACRVIGIAGSKEKCHMLARDLGFDATINYKTENMADALDRLCPDGIDIYFDNVGGSILDECLNRLSLHARIVLCGGISHYNLEHKPPGPSNYFNLVFRRATMQGFLLSDYTQRFDAARDQLLAWQESGRLKQKSTVIDGFSSLPNALVKLFDGYNLGKMMVRNDKFRD